MNDCYANGCEKNDHKCGKPCHQPNSPQWGWEEEFEEESWKSLTKEGGAFGSFDTGNDGSAQKVDWVRIRHFIERTLTSQKQSIVDALEGMKKEEMYDKGHPELNLAITYARNQYNQALDEAIALINGKE